jgi:hypothetical protein
MCDHDNEDVDIDICMGCGRYYSLTDSIIELWRQSPSFDEKQVVPQLCHRCMRNV